VVGHLGTQALPRTRRAWSSPPIPAGPTATGSAGLTITVCQYPPDTSKWNRIEHRLFSFISISWRGRSLTDIRTIVELISATTATTGLTAQASYDPNWYPTGEKGCDSDFATIPPRHHHWHGEWNYDITPT
jgi:hypothetical protein